MTAGVGVSPHFFRQHRLEKNAGLTPTLASLTGYPRELIFSHSAWIMLFNIEMCLPGQMDPFE